MVNVALNSQVSSQNNNESKPLSFQFQKLSFRMFSLDISLDEQSLNQALLSLESCEESSQNNSINAPTTVSVAELPSDITDSFNVAAKQLSLFYGSVVNPTPEEDEESIEHLGEEVNSNDFEPSFQHTTGKEN